MQRRIVLINLVLLLGAFIAPSTMLKAQCNGFVGDRGACPEEVVTVDFRNYPVGSGHYRFDYQIQTINMDSMPSPTPGLLHVKVHGGNPAIVKCWRYDSIYNCTIVQEHDIWVETLPWQVMTTTIPHCPDTSTTYLNVLNYLPVNIASPLISLQVLGGTIMQRHVVNPFQSYYDSIWVKWQAGVPHEIIATYEGHGTWSNACHIPITYREPGGVTQIVGPQNGCWDSFARSYSVSADTGYGYTWTAINGTIVGGQGTTTCNVVWQGSGRLIVEKSFLWCNTVFRDTLTYARMPGPINLGADTSVCADTSLILRLPPIYQQYTWSTGASQNEIAVTTGGTYWVNVGDQFGCQLRDTITVTGLNDCVFPGDANYDGVADNQDVLAIGAYYGRTGVARPSASTSWYGQAANDFGNPLPLAADPKHSDCDGDGLVQASDTAAVTLNYLQTHTKANTAATAGASLRAVPLSDTVVAGDLIWFAILLGDNASPADSVYGLAMHLDFTSPLHASLAAVDYSQCWFAAAGNRLAFTRNRAPAQQADIAIVRTDQVDAHGQGEVCRVAIHTDINQAIPYADLTLVLSDVHLVNGQLQEVAVLPGNGAVVIAQQAAAGTEAQALQLPQVFPNPASEVVHVVQPRHHLQQAALYDLQGHALRTYALPGLSQADISVADLAPGLYLLHITSAKGSSATKLAVQR
jgi:Secretion system C-terminal sorting domain